VAFLRALVAEVTTRYRVDADRVYATGHSNGMIMGYRLACEAADVFTAVAGQAGTLGIDVCAPAPGVSLLHIHGDADANLPIDGGRGDGISDVDFPSPRTGVRAFAAADGCDVTEMVTSDGPATTQRWTACDDGAVVEFVTVAGASHAWMGAPAPARPGAPEPFADYDSSYAVVSFLLAHPRPAG
jgi:polyhydroxybutyrate depolymerase